MFWLDKVRVLYTGCVGVLVVCSFCVCEGVSLTIALNALSSAGGIGTM